MLDILLLSGELGLFAVLAFHVYACSRVGTTTLDEA